MAEHPDMARARREVGALRIEDAWQGGLGLPLSDNATLRMNTHIRLFKAEAQRAMIPRLAPRENVKQRHPESAIFKKRRVQMAKKVASRRLHPRDDPTSSRFGCVMQSAPRASVKFMATSFATHLAFSTSSVLLTKKEEDGCLCVRTTFTIERDHLDRVITPGFRVPGPVLRTPASSMVIIQRFVNDYMFELYARIMAHMRVYLTINGSTCEAAAVDSDVSMFTSLGPKCPSGVIESPPPNSDADANTICRRLCKYIGVPTSEITSYDTSNSSSSSSEDDDDDSE